MPLLRLLAAVAILSPTVALSEEVTDRPVSGVYFAEKMAASPHFKASGIAWWNGRLIISNREPPKLHAFTPPDTFEAYRELTHPVGVAVDAKGRLVFTEKQDKVLYRVARLHPDGREEDLVREAGVANPIGVGPSGRAGIELFEAGLDDVVRW